MVLIDILMATQSTIKCSQSELLIGSNETVQWIHAIGSCAVDAIWQISTATKINCFIFQSDGNNKFSKILYSKLSKFFCFMNCCNFLCICVSQRLQPLAK